MWSHWWKLLWYNAFIAVVCHELGHCLGLAHRYTPPDNHGVMSGDLKPDVHDLDSVRGFYT
jgi:predicted Zn-dependent protease